MNILQNILLLPSDPHEWRDYHTPDSVQLLINTQELAFSACNHAHDGAIPAHSEELQCWISSSLYVESVRGLQLANLSSPAIITGHCACDTVLKCCRKKKKKSVSFANVEIRSFSKAFSGWLVKSRKHLQSCFNRLYFTTLPLPIVETSLSEF